MLHHDSSASLVCSLITAQVSDETKAVNARFGILHGNSSLANPGVVVALVFHGLCLGAYYEPSRKEIVVLQ
ncbi:hypothetical protein J3R82DRAFT_1003 [Butyriboletus roseoflavus]|nr:hypothetical protein J3R82DRAFT_1003 [Butyriboletus roseoflavus]